MYILPTKLSDFLFVFLLTIWLTSLSAQSMSVANVVVEENATHVHVPISVSLPDSASAIQLSIIWPETELRLDSLSFSLAFMAEDFNVVSNVLSDNEVRIGVLPVSSHLSVFGFAADTAAFVLSFTLMGDFKGATDVRFNPDFPIAFSDYYGNHIPATITNGTITFPDQTTSNRNLSHSAANISVFPNPAQDILQVNGLPNSDRNGKAAIIDGLGRELWAGRLDDAGLTLPAQLPNGHYWLVLQLEDGTCSKPVVISR